MGGTALAEYYIGHRESEDIDLFTLHPEAFPQLADRLAGWLPRRAGVTGVDSQIISPTLRRLWVRIGTAERFKIELLEDSPPRFGTPTIVDGMPVASLTDIAVGKLSAFITRDEPRDLVDLWGIERLAETPVAGFYPALYEKDPELAAYPQVIAEAWRRHGSRTYVAPLVLHVQPDVDLREFCREQGQAFIRYVRDRIQR